MDGLSRIRPAQPADARAVGALERRCFADPWSEGSFREAFGPGWSFGYVAEAGLDVTGYVVAREVAGSGEILNLAVAPEARREGLARALLHTALDALRRRGATEVYLEVRESNDGARRLYEAEGFTPAGRRRDYYRQPLEDALVLYRTLDDSAR
jgi:ribosomal-protein-alanine N-acetyltransferase